MTHTDMLAEVASIKTELHKVLQRAEKLMDAANVTDLDTYRAGTAVSHVGMAISEFSRFSDAVEEAITAAGFLRTAK